MDTTTRSQEQFVFHLTGREYGTELEPLDGLALRPALLAGLRDLADRRYDFPVVLVEDGARDGSIRSLSGLVDDLLRELAPRGVEGERLRRQVLRLEREIRARAAQGLTGHLSATWSEVNAEATADADERAVLAHAGEALKVDGEILDCDEAMPARLVRHQWCAVEARKARRFHAHAGALAVKLSDILRAAFVHSEAGRRAESLRASVGGPDQEVFDFAVMSRLLPRVAPVEELPDTRRERIERALSVLRSQRFFAPPEGRPASDGVVHLGFAFDDCASAMAAFRERRGAMAELVKATAIAELEADGRYDEAAHDPVFAAFEASSLGPADLAGFPGYLVCIPPGGTDATENATLMEILASGLPIKVLAQTDEVLEASPGGDGHLVFGARGAQLASAAVGLDDVFVLQSSSSHLYRVRARIHDGMAYPGPALFSVFSASRTASPLPAYLVAAAAMEARAFPSFSCDPAAGSDWASRFAMDDNPQPSLDWPVEDFDYADEALQRVREPLAFTLADFAASDRRYAGYFARVPRSQWNADMIPVERWLALASGERASKVPYVLVVDDADVLHRLLVDARMMEASARCRERWRRLQELGGIHDPYAERLLARERAAWEGRLAALERPGDDGPAGAGQTPPQVPAQATAAASGPAEPPPPVAPSPGAAAAGDGAETALPERDPDEPSIETIRCSSCNECTLINDRLFAYNANKQAYIADLRAGTFRDLVEAAENCQLSIIHPGKPWDPNEPGLDELLTRAAPFA